MLPATFPRQAILARTSPVQAIGRARIVLPSIDRDLGNTTATMSLRIMLVDDDPASLGSLSRLLEKRGYSVKPISDSRTARDAALDFQPHVVILDYLMPVLRGGDVAWQIASDPFLRGTRIIILSAYSAGEIQRKLPATPIPILPKPIDFDVLVKLIQAETGQFQENPGADSSPH